MTDEKNILTPEDKKVIRSLKKDSEKFRSLIFAGVFSIIVGLLIGIGSLLRSADESYIIAGIFFITIGIITVKDSVRTRKVYLLLSKFLHD